MNLDLEGKVIVVSGGDKGIGKGISMTLASEGAIPFILARREKDILKTIEEISNAGGRAHYALAELTNSEDCKKAIEKVLVTCGQIDGLVNNAGVNDGVGLENGSLADFRQSLERNVVHYYHLAQLALPALKKSNGSIVNIGSKVSITGQGNTSGYAAANGARNSLTREWAVELLPYGIRVNTVIVAECFTPLYQRWIASLDDADATLKKIKDKIPLGKRMTTPEEIANMVTFLLSSKSSHTTGQLIFVDGGYSHLDRALS